MLQVDLKSFAKSGGKRLIVESLRLDGLTLTVEKQDLQTSNVTDLVEKLKQDDRKGMKGSGDSNASPTSDGDLISNVVDISTQAVNVGMDAIEKGTKAAVASAKAVQENAEKIEANDKQMQVIVQKLEICGIQLEAVSSILSDNQTPTMQLSVADIKYDDFSSHAARPEHMIRLILEQIVFSSLNVMASETKLSFLMVKLMLVDVNGC